MATNVTMNSCIEMGLTLSNYQPNSTVDATFANVSYTGGELNLVATPIHNGVEEYHTLLDFGVFPNPTSGEIQVDLSKYLGRKVRLEVLNPEGQLVKWETIAEVQGVGNLDLSAFPEGVYFIRIKSEGVPGITKKVVVN